MRLPSRTCLLLAAAACASGPALAGNIYKWKDANGVTHSSDQPPSGQHYEVDASADALRLPGLSGLRRTAEQGRERRRQSGGIRSMSPETSSIAITSASSRPLCAG